MDSEWPPDWQGLNYAVNTGNFAGLQNFLLTKVVERRINFLSPAAGPENIYVILSMSSDSESLSYRLFYQKLHSLSICKVDIFQFSIVFLAIACEFHRNMRTWCNDNLKSKLIDPNFHSPLEDPRDDTRWNLEASEKAVIWDAEHPLSMSCESRVHTSQPIVGKTNRRKILGLGSNGTWRQTEKPDS